MKLTTITALADWPVPAELREHLVQVSPRVDNFITVFLDGADVGTLIYERSSPTVVRPRGGTVRSGRSAISRWKFEGRTFYSRTEAAWAAARAALTP